MAFNYFYGDKCYQYSFVRIPRTMVTDRAFKKLSAGAKLLYGLLLDRMGLADKNPWYDEENHVFVIYPTSEIQVDLGVTDKMVTKYMNELEEFGLVEKKVRGNGFTNLIYVKKYSGIEN